MQQSRAIHSGERGGYHWLVSPDFLSNLTGLVLEFHRGLRLCITSFDSGVIRPSEEEIDIGWSTLGSVMVSPPLTESLELPHDEYDEWYILDSPSFASGEFEVFVNYGGFTLVSPDEIYKTYDSTWEKTGLDYLTPIQERFWSQLEQLNPKTFVAMGDLDVVVTRDREFLSQLRTAV